MSHTINTRAAKRTRLADYPQSPVPSTSTSLSSTAKSKLKRHPEFWFDDENIVLVARQTAFRIYCGLLSSQSTVFSDMFASSSSSADETFHGCPVVYLSDSPHDLAHLLHVLLPKSRIHYQPTDFDPVRTFDEVFALVRLAHKYLIQPVQDQALAVLRLLDFTSNFDIFCAGGASPRNPLCDERAQAISVVNLARLTDTLSMLPLALYQCAYLGSAVLDGWTRRDGTVEHLSPADLRRCIDGRTVLGQEQFFLLSRLLDDTPSVGCTQFEYCQEMLGSFHHVTVRSPRCANMPALWDWADALRDWGELSVCDACQRELVDRNRRERRKIWNKLPEIFNIEVEGWGEPESEVEDSDNE